MLPKLPLTANVPWKLVKMRFTFISEREACNVYILPCNSPVWICSYISQVLLELTKVK
jgi:hypothetical protein